MQHIISLHLSILFTIILHTTFLRLSPTTAAADNHDYQPLTFPTPTPSTTIPAFPEQSDALTNTCPLHLPDALFSSISHSCTTSPLPPSRARCCPALAAWLYSAHAAATLTAAAAAPVLPDDSEACLAAAEKALAARGVVVGRVNESCGVVGCYCGVRVGRFGCKGALTVAKEDGKWVAKDEVARRVERSAPEVGEGCNRCLRSLYQVTEKAVEENTTSHTYAGGGPRLKKNSRREPADRDCQLMGLTWLLAKNRTLYLPTVTKILRAFMMSPDGQDPLSCTLGRDGLPLAVGSFDDGTASSSASDLTVGSFRSSPCLRWIGRCGLVWSVTFVLFWVL